MKSEKVRSQFSIPAGVYDWLKERAQQAHRSVSGQLAAELEARMKEQGGVKLLREP